MVALVSAEVVFLPAVGMKRVAVNSFVVACWRPIFCLCSLAVGDNFMRSFCFLRNEPEQGKNDCIVTFHVGSRGHWSGTWTYSVMHVRIQVSRTIPAYSGSYECDNGKSSINITNRNNSVLSMPVPILNTCVWSMNPCRCIVVLNVSLLRQVVHLRKSRLSLSHIPGIIVSHRTMHPYTEKVGALCRRGNLGDFVSCSYIYLKLWHQASVNESLVPTAQ